MTNSTNDAGLPDIRATTRVYEAWLARHNPVVTADLKAKHAVMAADPFSFFRATFYHAIRRFTAECPELAEAPTVLSVGDIHVENYGSWRDAEGRLVWGVNDFDEAQPLPYTQDLVRLATSALLAREVHGLKISPGKACVAILDGYRNQMEDGGSPFVLEEHSRWLRKTVFGSEREPARFWEKMSALPAAKKTPREVTTLLRAAMPAGVAGLRFVTRRSGLGSLGRPRHTALAEWGEAGVAREAKALVPPARPAGPGAETYVAEILRLAVRVPDPFHTVSENWTLRRLSPHCCRIGLDELDDDRDEEKLLRAMGRELANIHLGSRKARAAVSRDLDSRSDKWLLHAARRRCEATHADYARWCAA
jgi:hypothetical protein